MLAPRPGQTVDYPRPIKLVSKSALFKAWDESRDATGRPGTAGVDGVTAKQFAAKLDSNLSNISKRLTARTFGFSSLRAVFIPKPNSDKDRLICVPTVQDRLVQRVIAKYLCEKNAFPIYNSSSFGFIKGRGTREAILRTVQLRNQYKWCLKTDIEAFFDRIPRVYLKQRVSQCLRRNSLVPLIHDVIDCEAKITPWNRQKFQSQKIQRGCGVRQGMPLSPLLANLALSDFDEHISKTRIPMVRYADDLVLFFDSKEDALDGQKMVKALLDRIQLSIPDISEVSKTRLVSSSEPMDFLGREIVYIGSERRFVSRVGSRQINKIKERLSGDFSFKNRLSKKDNFQCTIFDLEKSLAAYLGIYQDAHNFDHFHAELQGHSRTVISAIFLELFGQEPLKKLSPEGRRFLGIQLLDQVTPNPEFDV